MRRKYPYLESPYYEDENGAKKKREFFATIDKFVNHKQYVRITLLNWVENPIKEIAGELTSGSISKDGASSVRTNCQLQASVNGNEYSVEDGNMDFAINKKVFIELGVKNYSHQYKDYPILWFPQGVFFITDFNISSGSTTSVNISLSLKDKMAGLNGEIGGKFPATTVLDEMDTQSASGAFITEKVKLYDLITEVVHHWGGEDLNNIIIEDVPLRIRRVMRWMGDNPIWLIHKNGTAEAGDLWYDVVTDPPDNTLQQALQKVLEDLGNKQDAEAKAIKSTLDKVNNEITELENRLTAYNRDQTLYSNAITELQGKMEFAENYAKKIEDLLAKYKDSMTLNNWNNLLHAYDEFKDNASAAKEKEVLDEIAKIQEELNKCLSEQEYSLNSKLENAQKLVQNIKSEAQKIQLNEDIMRYTQEISTFQLQASSHKNAFKEIDNRFADDTDSLNATLIEMGRVIDTISEDRENSNTNTATIEHSLNELAKVVEQIKKDSQNVSDSIARKKAEAASLKNTLSETAIKNKTDRENLILSTTEEYYKRVENEDIWSNNPMPIMIENGMDAGYIYDDFYYTSELVMQAGQNVTDALDQIKQYLGNYEYFYDEFGIFHFREIKNYMNTTQGKIVLEDMSKNDYLVEVTTNKSEYTFSDDSNLINITVNPQYGNIKNDYIVQGKREGSSSDVSYPVRYHLAIDKKPQPGNVYYDLLLYQEVDTNLVKAAFPFDVQKYSDLPLPGNFNLIYRVMDDNSFYYWEDDSYKEVVCVAFYPNNIGKANVPDFFKQDGYKTKDWRTELFLQGLLNKNNGTSANNAYQEIVQNPGLGITDVTWLGDIYRSSRNQQLDVDFYYEELDAFWPTIYDLSKQQFYAESSDKTLYTSALCEGNYYLDFIDPQESQLGEFCVQNIGRRTQVTVNDDINCLFQPDIPDIVFLNVDDDDFQAKREECQKAGQPYTQVRGELYTGFSTGGYKNGAFDQIKYELYVHTTYQKSLSLVALPAFYLQPNTRVTLNDKTTNTYGDFMVTNISLPLGSGNMSVTCSQCFERF